MRMADGLCSRRWSDNPRFGLALLLAATAVLAGCLEGPTTKQATVATKTPTTDNLAPPIALQPGPRKLVSPPGHRVSEFAAAWDPTNPLHLLVGFMDYDDPNGVAGCTTAYSTDGGQSWKPGRAVPGLEQSRFRPDPWVAFDPGGNAHLTCMQGNTRPLLYARSVDKGATWSQGVPLPFRVGVDKDAIYASRDGILHVCYHDGRFLLSSPSLEYLRSEDGGLTWSGPETIDPTGTACNGIVESRLGHLHLVWFRIPVTDFSDYRVYTVTSGDGGKTWGQSVEVARLRAPPEGAYAGRFYSPTPFLSVPSIAAARDSDQIFVASHEWSDAERRLVLRLHRSTDGGRTYAPMDPPRISGQACPGCHATHPTLLLNEKDGMLGLQVTLVPPGLLGAQTWFAASPDFGATWLEPVLVARTGPTESWVDARTWTGRDAETLPRVVQFAASNPSEAPDVMGDWVRTRLGPGAIQHRNGGEYWNILPHPQGFVALWVDHYQNGVPQLWSSIVKVERTSLAHQESPRAPPENG